MKTLRNSRLYILLGCAFMAVLAFILTLFTNGAKVTYSVPGVGVQIDYIFSGLLVIFGGNGKITILTTPSISFADEDLYFKKFFFKRCLPFYNRHYVLHLFHSSYSRLCVYDSPRTQKQAKSKTFLWHFNDFHNSIHSHVFDPFRLL